jgi:lysylphosphatidylglycerol synthetase-like protein (DUF2156 family)
VRWLAPHAGILFPLLTALAILVTFGAVNLVIVVMLPPFERRASRLWDARWAVVIALVLTFMELAGATLLRVELLRLAQIIGAAS